MRWKSTRYSGPLSSGITAEMFQRAYKCTYIDVPHYKGLIGLMENRITEDHIERLIEKETVATVGEKTTVVVLTLKNGFEAVGTSSCVSKDNYSESVGKTFARKKALDIVWAVEGYKLQETLYRASKAQEGFNVATQARVTQENIHPAYSEGVSEVTESPEVEDDSDEPDENIPEEHLSAEDGVVPDVA